jgi:acyl-coenzyme A synthetase/AMP-(fatty) acid ligase
VHRGELQMLLLGAVRARLATIRNKKGAHQVSRAVHVVDELPLIAAGKIDKKLLRAPHKTAN